MIENELKSYILALTLPDDGTTKVIATHSELAYAQYSAVTDIVTPMTFVRDFPRIAEIDLDFVVRVLSELNHVPRMTETFITPSYKAALAVACVEIGTPIDRLNSLVGGGSIKRLLIPAVDYLLTDSDLFKPPASEEGLIPTDWSSYNVPSESKDIPSTGIAEIPDFTHAKQADEKVSEPSEADDLGDD